MSYQDNPIRVNDNGWLFTIDKHEDDCQDNADNDAGGEGEIKGNVFPLVAEVTGKASDPRYFPAQHEKGSNPCDDQANHEKDFTEA
jgi:hypothetical protein